MNRFYPMQKILSATMKNGNQVVFLFASFRLIKLMAKKLNNGEWDFTYFKIDEFDLSPGYVGVLLGLDGRLICYKNN